MTGKMVSMPSTVLPRFDMGLDGWMVDGLWSVIDGKTDVFCV